MVSGHMHQLKSYIGPSPSQNELIVFESIYHAHCTFQHTSLFGGGKEGEHLPDSLRTGEHIFVCLNPACYNSLSPQSHFSPQLDGICPNGTGKPDSHLLPFTILSPARVVVSLAVGNPVRWESDWLSFQSPSLLSTNLKLSLHITSCHQWRWSA